MKTSQIRKGVLLFGVAASLWNPIGALAAEQPAEQSLPKAEATKAQKETAPDSKELRQQIAALEKELKRLRQKKTPASNEKVEELQTEMAALSQRLIEHQTDKEYLAKILERLERLETKQASSAPYPADNQSIYLVNPGEREVVSYTQDAVNSQGNSTMVFRYAPNQLYKIYCRVGYLTDLSFRKGETISFVGGGDTSAWAVNTSTVDGVPHLYVKPTVGTSTTNLIVTTDKRSYQLILTTSNWYNPMVSWTYGLEEREEARFRQERDERNLVGTFQGDVASLHFDYKISGASETKPSVVFDDGAKTVLKWDRLPARKPALFLKEKGKKGVSLASYTVRGNCYILDRVADEAELRMSDKEIVRIRRKG